MVKLGGADRNINRVLLANAVTLFMALASYPVFCYMGECSTATTGYIVVTIGLFTLCAVALCISKYIGALVGLVFYCWCGFCAIAGMMTMDIVNGAVEFPWILYLLVFGVFSLKHFRVDFHWQIFTVATILLVVLAGVIYKQYDQAIACAMTTELIALIGGNNDDRK